MGVSYSVEVDDEITSRAMGREIPMSFKDAVEICRHIKGMDYLEAVNALRQVISEEQPIPIKKHNTDVGHSSKIEGWDAARYPERVSREILDIIENAAGNADYQGMNPDGMYVKHIAAHKVGESRGMKPRAMGTADAWNRPEVDVEVILEQREDEIQRIEEEDEEKEDLEEETEEKVTGPAELTDVEGVSEAKAESLREAGYSSVDDLRAASREELMDVSGIGKALSARIKADIGEAEPDTQAEETTEEPSEKTLEEEIDEGTESEETQKDDEEQETDLEEESSEEEESMESPETEEEQQMDTEGEDESGDEHEANEEQETEEEEEGE